MTIVHWNDAKKTEPMGMQTILINYEGFVWPGVYANGKVTLYPEDFGTILLKDCMMWSALPHPVNNFPKKDEDIIGTPGQ